MISDRDKHIAFFCVCVVQSNMSSNRGRKKTVVNSKEQVFCPVPGCSVEGRQDNVKRHLRKTVVWSCNELELGEPAGESELNYVRASKDRKSHTTQH